MREISYIRLYRILNIPARILVYKGTAARRLKLAFFKSDANRSRKNQRIRTSYKKPHEASCARTYFGPRMDLGHPMKDRHFHI